MARPPFFVWMTRVVVARAHETAGPWHTLYVGRAADASRP
jgi:hypothetical protein